MDVQARVATVEDVPELVELYRAYRSALAGERGGSTHLLKEAFVEPLEETFRSIVHDEQWLVLLGTLRRRRRSASQPLGSTRCLTGRTSSASRCSTSIRGT